MIGRAVGAGLVGPGLIGGAGAVVYNDDGSATVTIKDRSGQAQTVRLEGGGKMFSCPDSTEAKISPYDVRLGRIDLTLRQVRRKEGQLERRYPDQTAPAPVVNRYNSLLRRDKRLVAAYNTTVDERNAIIDADCE